MKLAFIVATFPSKSEVPVLNVICELERLGHQITIFRFNTGYKNVKSVHSKFKLLKIRIVDLPKPSLSRFQHKWQNKISISVQAIPYLLYLLWKAPLVLWQSLTDKQFDEFRKSHQLFLRLSHYLV